MKELLAWLEANSEHLTTYTLDEIAERAIASGQDRAAVAMWLTRKKFEKAA